MACDGLGDPVVCTRKSHPDRLADGRKSSHGLSDDDGDISAAGIAFWNVFKSRWRLTAENYLHIARGKFEPGISQHIAPLREQRIQPQRAETTPPGSLGCFEGLSDVAAVFVLLRRVRSRLFQTPLAPCAIARVSVPAGPGARAKA